MDSLPLDIEKLILEYVPKEPIVKCVECRKRDLDNSLNFSKSYEMAMYDVKVCHECFNKRYCCLTCQRRHVYSSRFYPN